MKRYLLLLVLMGNLAFGDAKVLKVILGEKLPPWVIVEENRGILIDILKETLEPEGYEIQVEFVPFSRRFFAYKLGGADAICDINPNVIDEQKLDGYLSDIAYAYENIGVSLKKNGFHFEKIEDLKNYRVIGWKGAQQILGGEYQKMAEANKQYTEMDNQHLQVRLLYMARTDVIQLDQHIFKYLSIVESKLGFVEANQEVSVFPLFGKNESSFLFKSEEVQKLFNRRLKEIQASGVYETIFQKYYQ